MCRRDSYEMGWYKKKKCLCADTETYKYMKRQTIRTPSMMKRPEMDIQYGAYGEDE